MPDREITVSRLAAGIFALAQVAVMWVFATTINHEKRLTAMEANRWTSSHQAAFQTRLEERLDALPPQLFVDYVRLIERRVERLEDGE